MKPPSAIVVAARQPPARLSLTTLADTFFSRLSPLTRKGYEADLRRMAAWAGYESTAAFAAALCKLPVQDANVLVDEYVLALQKPSEAMPDGYAPATINRAVAAVKSLTKLARKLGLVSWVLEPTGVKPEARREVKGPDVAQVRQLFAAARGAREKAILSLLFLQGFRGIEVRRLKLEHVQEGVLLVKRKGRRELQPLKVTQATEVAVRAWMRERGTAPGFLFEVKGGQMSGSALWALVRRVGKRAGLHVWPHGLRHAAITAGLNALDGDLRTVQDFSGHESVDMLRRYDDSRGGGAVTVADRLSKMLEEKEQ